MFFIYSSFVLIAVCCFGSYSPTTALIVAIVYVSFAGFMLIAGFPSYPVAAGAIVKVTLDLNTN